MIFTIVPFACALLVFMLSEILLERAFYIGKILAIVGINRPIIEACNVALAVGII